MREIKRLLESINTDPTCLKRIDWESYIRGWGERFMEEIIAWIDDDNVCDIALGMMMEHYTLWKRKRILGKKVGRGRDCLTPEEEQYIAHSVENLKRRLESAREDTAVQRTHLKEWESKLYDLVEKQEEEEPSKQVHTEAISTPTKEIKNNTSATSLLLPSIEALMEEKDEDGEYLVSKQTHWMAIFRIIVDKNLGASNTDFLGFCNMINKGKPEGFRIALKHESLKKISNTKYIKPFGEWAYDPTYNPTRKPYDEMVKIATRFKEILEENGF